MINFSQNYFFPLINYSDYSLGEGFSFTQELVKEAKERGFDALGCADNETCAGLYEFVHLCEDAGIKPIPGETLWISNKDLTLKEDKKEADVYSLVLFPKNKQGLEHLFMLNYLASLPENEVRGRKSIDYSLLEVYKEGLLAVTGGETSPFLILLKEKKKEALSFHIQKLKELFGEDLYMGIPPFTKYKDYDLNSLLEFSKKEKIKTFFAPLSRYTKEEDKVPFNALIASFNENKMSETPINKGGRRKAIGDDFLSCFCHDEVFNSETFLFISQEDSAKNLKEIRDKVNISFKYNTHLRPQLKNMKEDSYTLLLSHLKRGFKEKRGLDSKEIQQKSLSRIKEELEMITSNDFLDYFLVVEDYCRWSKEHGISRGGGRGSAAGSEIAYLLDITDVDPLKYGLLFERFLSPGRSAIMVAELDEGKRTLSVSDKVKIENDPHRHYAYQLKKGDRFFLEDLPTPEKVLEKEEDKEKQGEERKKLKEEGERLGELGPFAVSQVEVIKPGESPDIDMDFLTRGRGRVIQYLKEEYGEDKVAGIITYGKLLAKSAIKLVLSTFGVPYGIANQLSKLLPSDLKLTVSHILEKAEDTEEFWAYGASKVHLEIRGEHFDLDDLVRIAERCEGRMKAYGVHACGMIISPCPLSEVVPVVENKDKGLIVEWSYNPICESLGLIKMDFLGLDTLDIIDLTCQNIKENQGKSVDPKVIMHGNMDDPEVYKIIQKGETTGVFQLTNSGMQELLKSLKPTKFSQLYAVVAIYRPGPMALNAHISYTKRALGEEESLPLNSPKLKGTKIEDLLKETHGLILFQEQLMNLAGEVSHFSPAERDALRKGTAKKKPKILAELGPKFMAGIEKEANKGKKPGDPLFFTEKDKEELWEQILGFASYSFNKSHSVGYAELSYMTAYLKTYYPVEFMAASFSLKSTDPDKLKELIAEAKRMGIPILAPDINRSETETKAEGKHLLIGLGLLKGVSNESSDIILQERKAHGEFKSLFDFVSRLKDTGVVNKRICQPLAFTGAFNAFGLRPEETFKELMKLIKETKKTDKSLEKHGLPLFFQEKKDTVQIPKILQLSYEYEYLGVYLSGHPVDLVPEEFGIVEKDLATNEHFLAKDEEGTTFNFFGVLVDLQLLSSKKTKRPYAKLLIDTGARTDSLIEAIVFYRNESKEKPLSPRDKANRDMVKNLKVGGVYAFYTLQRPFGRKEKMIQNIELKLAPPEIP